MRRPGLHRPLDTALRIVAALGVLAAFAPATLGVRASDNAIVPPPSGASIATVLPAWTGGVNLYRSGVFTTQASWLYCTAADVQIARNMAEGAADHRASAQKTYFDWMRARNKYDIPLSAGVDPAGWLAGMRHFVDDRYRLVSSDSFGSTLQLAAQRIRLTNLPVAIAVAHGDHGWLLNGFTATADPAKTSDFEITSVSVTGPLWGLQSKGGYDMKPNTKLTLDQLRTYFTRWHYDPLPMIWDGTFVSIQPIPAEAPSATAAPTSTPTVVPTPTATPQPSPTGTPDVTQGPPPSAAPADPTQAASTSAPGGPVLVGVIVLVAAGVVAAAAMRGRRGAP